MALTRAEAQKMISDRLREYPELGAVVAAPDFKKVLLDIIRFEGIGDEWYPVVENELLVVLALYAPLGELAKNISETTNIPLDTCKRIALMIDTLLLESVHDELVLFEAQWYTQLEAERKQQQAQPVQTPIQKPVATPPPAPQQKPVVAPQQPPIPQTPPRPQVPPPQPKPPVPERPATLPKIETKLRDKLELRPEGVPAQNSNATQSSTKPLSRNDLLDYLNVKRTMAADVAVAQAHAGQKLIPTPPGGTPGNPVPQPPAPQTATAPLTPPPLPRPGSAPAGTAASLRPGNTPPTPPLRPINFPTDKK